jgi:glycerol-3-phosphate dehydrogenase (NAD(P)+)
MKIGIIGTGAYSVGIAFVLSNNKDNKITMWSENEELVKDFKKTKKLNKIVEGKTIPKNISITNSMEDTLNDAEVVFLLTSINYVEDVCKNIKSIISPKVPICIGTKGIYDKRFAYQIVAKNLKNPLTIISGPTFASDLINMAPVGFTLAGKNKKSALKVKNVLSFSNIKIETSKDMLGISINGCLKNIYAIGSGIIKGLGYNESTLGLYLTQSYQELANILCKYNSTMETLNSLSGLGDLIATCSSTNSRNYTLGSLIGKKTSSKEVTKYIENNTVEGYTILEVMSKMLKKKHVKTPLLNTIYNIVKNNENPQKLINEITKKAS